MCSLINKQLLLTAYAYLFIIEQQKAQQGSEAGKRWHWEKELDELTRSQITEPGWGFADHLAMQRKAAERFAALKKWGKEGEKWLVQEDKTWQEKWGVANQSKPCPDGNVHISPLQSIAAEMKVRRRWMMLSGRWGLGLCPEMPNPDNTAPEKLLRDIQKVKQSFLSFLQKRGLSDGGEDIWNMLLDENTQPNVHQVCRALQYKFSGASEHSRSQLALLQEFFASRVPTKSTSQQSTAMRPILKGASLEAQVSRGKSRGATPMNAKSMVEFFAKQHQEAAKGTENSIIEMISLGTAPVSPGMPDTKECYMVRGSCCDLWAQYFAHLYPKFRNGELNDDHMADPATLRKQWEKEAVYVDFSSKLSLDFKLSLKEENGPPLITIPTEDLDMRTTRSENADPFPGTAQVAGDAEWQKKWMKQVTIGPGAAHISHIVGHVMFVDWTDPDNCYSLQGWYINETEAVAWTPAEFVVPGLMPMQTRLRTTKGGSVVTAQRRALGQEEADVLTRIAQPSTAFLELKRDFGNGKPWKCSRLRDMLSLVRQVKEVNRRSLKEKGSSDSQIKIIRAEKRGRVELKPFLEYMQVQAQAQAQKNMFTSVDDTIKALDFRWGDVVSFQELKRTFEGTLGHSRVKGVTLAKFLEENERVPPGVSFGEFFESCESKWKAQESNGIVLPEDPRELEGLKGDNSAEDE